MGFSKLKIPRVCEHCSKPFEAKTITTRFCSVSCANKAGKLRKRVEKEQKEKETLLKKYSSKIAEVQTREFISIAEATVMFGISKDTLHRLLKKGIITGTNLGVRLTRVRRVDLEVLFTAVELPIEKETEPEKLDYAISDCYTLSEISSKFNANPSTVSSVIRKFSIPKKQVGNFVYVPKDQIDKIFAGK
ncbi:DNA-binding protein [Elizabethkingia anophelis]|uniref:helix-turn-helix transcriptional regulator n=1 Tax=Elizabethkingia TaxID=308865 RepID=UPI001368B7BF|nr:MULTISPECIES: helix-turn-helix domain-containing protein [Elizabethkingia]MCL1669544.1 helix-turn-helix domain-containing protein [Elizabethkingia ursingii]MDV3574994.1 DNA-binding protein [Elizabethkingia anophelis]MDV3599285.1 DNA-binding protein [Elizabethkingia anophelis]MDV3607151.1 DNA-binding protein [Elizabethkingia anophelis]MDV3640345.1 DNA-binding protein [Elizabethkingia anophelis]